MTKLLEFFGFDLREAKSMQHYGGPTRWDGSGEQRGQMYDEAKWNSDESKFRFDRLVRMYDFVWLPGSRKRKAVDAETMISGMPPYLPEDGQTLFEWLMFIDDYALGQDLRMAIQDGPWEEVLKVVAEVAAEGGIPQLPPPKGGGMAS